MIRLPFIILIFSSLACSKSNKYPLENDLDIREVYELQLEQINKKISSGITSKELYYRKLYTNQQLGWPEDVSGELKELITQEGLDFQLYQYAGDYYLYKKLYSDLNALVDRWLRIHSPSIRDLKWKVQALRGLGKSEESGDFLWSILHESDHKEDLLFVANEYTNLRDTAHALMTYNRVAELFPGEKSLVTSYVPILLAKGYPDQAREVLVQLSDFINEPEEELILAETLYELGNISEAMGIARSFETYRSFDLLAGWYQQQEEWDSAVFYSNKLVDIDSSRATVYKRATILEDRGWLESALRNYSILIEADPQDSIAISRAKIVEGKIAYLRRLRESQRKIPVLTIPSKKSTEDNE